MGLARKTGVVVLIVLLIGGVIGAAFFAGVLGTPSAGVEDHGDWGTVSEERTEVITTAWVDNPNPIGLTVGDSVRMSYQLYLNDVNLASGKKSGIGIGSGNNTVHLSTYIRNQDIAPWWVAFVNDNETIPVRADASVRVGGRVTTSVDFSVPERTLLTDETPVITALSETASGFEGTYTESVSRDGGLEAGGYLDGIADEATVGYEIRDGWAEWGEVNEDTTTVYFHFRVHNPGDIPVPASPENVGLEVDMNDVEMFSARANDTSLQNPGDFPDGEVIDGRVLMPGETEKAVYAVEMENENVDDWFRSHVKQNEHTDVRTEAKLVFSVEGVTFSIPNENPLGYTCELQTAILVDDRNTSTNCGQGESIDGVDDTDDESEQDRQQLTADAQASPTSGQAPLAVEFDASDSTATDTGIVEYVWTFADGSTPQSGAQVTHTFSEAGQYKVELTVRDDAGNTATDTVTVEVQPETSSAPTAVAEADPTSGEAPLEVEFDASGSSDPDSDIEQYVWRFKDGSPPAEGESVTHTFRTAGDYDVEVVVIDSQGNRDSATVTVEVTSRIG